MCISYYEIQTVATEEENKILLNEHGGLAVYDYTWDSPKYNEWYRVYDYVVSQYHNRKDQKRREAIRLQQEKELQAKERELWNAAKSLGLQLTPASCRIKREHKEQELLHV